MNTELQKRNQQKKIKNLGIVVFSLTWVSPLNSEAAPNYKCVRSSTHQRNSGFN